MEVYLAEGRSIGGLSGSPVFIRQTVNLILKDDQDQDVPFAGLGQLYLLGMMIGHWELPASFGKTENTEAVNMGISMIVPIDKIKEIIYSPEMLVMRDHLEQDLLREYGPVADSEFGTQITPKDAKIPIPSKEQVLDDLTRASRKIDSTK